MIAKPLLTGAMAKPTNFDSVKSRLRLAILSSHARCRSSSLLVNQSRCNHPNIRKVCCEPALRRMTLCDELVFVERGERSFRHDDAWAVRCLFPNRDNPGDGWDGDGRGCYE